MTPELQAAIDALNLRMDCTFVPFSHSRHAKPGQVWHSINWRVKLTAPNGHTLETEYAQGTGHLDAKALKSACGGFPVNTRVYADCESTAIERCAYCDRFGNARAKVAPPILADVLYSLVLDAGAKDYLFADWCVEYGYDTDSIRARETYEACRDNGLKLHAMVGSLDRLTELFQDY